VDLSQEKDNPIDRIVNEIKQDNQAGNTYRSEKENNMEENKNAFEMEIDRSMRRAGISEKWINARFNQLTRIQDTDYLEMIRELRKWNFSEPALAGILCHSNGIGKTHIAKCLLRKYFHNRLAYQIDNNISYKDNEYRFYVKERDILYRILASYKQNSEETEMEIIKYYSNLEFLIIDDLFRNRQNEFATRVILDIIDERVDEKGLPTFITSNFLLEEIKEMGSSALASRINTNLLFEFKTDFEIDCREKK
jgi:DNA replication protein DnaC